MNLAFFQFLIWLAETKTMRTEYQYAFTAITWVVAALALIWLVWFIAEKIIRARLLRRKPRREKDKRLKQIVKVKDELTSRWLRKGASKKIHAVGIGKLANDEFCIQIFINDSNEKHFEMRPAEQIPNVYKNIPLVLVMMPQASFLSAENPFASFSMEEYRQLIREKQDVIIGGISGANANLDGNSGTIGYFCRKKSIFPRRSEVYLLSNSHVFADLRRMNVEAHDFILQPSPGEGAASRPIAELTHLSPLKFENDVTNPNFVDVAIAKLFREQPHKFLLPFIGEIKRYAKTETVEIGEKAQKFGRTTGYTNGKIFSIFLDIWIKYDRTGKEAFFKDQFLVEPEKESYEKFVDKGDSGSLLADGENNALGLVFAGANGNLEIKNEADAAPEIIKVSNYGLANPIETVMEKMKIELILD